MPRDESVYFRHILEAIERIENYVAGFGLPDFQSNFLVQDGVIRQLEIIGEAVRRISRETRSRQKGIPWQDIAGMRDKLTHDYFGVDIEKVWLTVSEDLKPLKEKVIELLGE